MVERSMVLNFISGAGTYKVSLLLDSEGESEGGTSASKVGRNGGKTLRHCGGAKSWISR